MLIGFLLIVLPIAAIICTLLYLPYYLYRRKKYGKCGIWFHLPRYMLLGYALSLTYLTILWSFPYITLFPDHHFLNLHPFIWVKETYAMGVSKMLEQLFLNILMFLPYGILLPIVFPKLQNFWKTAGIVCLTTVSIEVVQYFIGRSADIDDVIMNLTGGATGYLLFWIWRKCRGN